MKNFKIILVSIILIFFIIGAVSAEDNLTATNDTKEIYISDTGDDSNLGSETSPYASLNKAISNVTASDTATIHISKGTYATDKDSNFNINLNHKVNGGSLSFVGESKDETIIDGQSAFKFATFGQNTNITLKNMTLINFKNANGGTIYSTGILTIENCKFENSYATSSRGGAIFIAGDEASLTVKNSDFIKTSVNKYEVGNNYIQGGGAIYARDVKELNLVNNIFDSVKLANANLRGVAVVSGSKTYMANNKFINLIGTTSDASFIINHPGVTSTLINNEFINCSISSDKYSIVELTSGNYVWRNNTFINSESSVGNIYLSGTCNDMLLNMTREIDFGNDELKNGYTTQVSLNDDKGNIVKAERVNLRFIGADKTYEDEFFIENDQIRLSFDEVPENGKYDVFMGDNKVSTINVNLTNPLIEVYVAPNGNDANSGSKTSPYKTVEYALSKALENTFTVIVHVAKGTYTDEGNVGFSLSGLGNIQIIGEEYGNTIFDAGNEYIFMNFNRYDVKIENITFTKGYVKGGNLLTGAFLKDCIVTNSKSDYSYNEDGSGTGSYTLNEVNFDNLVYTDNDGIIWATHNISNSYFANNKNSAHKTGYKDEGILYLREDLTIENSKFINNTGNEYGIICVEYGSLTSKNNLYEGNKATNSAVFHLGNSKYYFENDTFIKNSAENYAVFGTDSDDYAIAVPTFNGCTFKNNKATKGGALGLKQGTIVNCTFEENTADLGGAIVITPIYLGRANVNELKTITIETTIFNNNNATNGKDIYLDSTGMYNNYKLDLIDLTVKFNDLTITTLSSVLTANVTGPCNAVVGGNTISFILSRENIGSSEIKNGVASIRQDGLENGKYTLTGALSSAAPSSKITDGTIIVNNTEKIEYLEVWISNSGDDETGNGSQAKPFKTIAHGLDYATKKSTQVMLHIMKGTYEVSGLELSSNIDLALSGDGIDNTVINVNGESFATVSQGSKPVKISNMTIQNATTAIVVENGRLNVNNVKFTNNTMVIENTGNVTIANSILTKNGGADYILSAGNIKIINSLITDNYAKYRILNGKSLIISNSTICDNFVEENNFMLIRGTTLIIEDSTIKNTGKSAKEAVGVEKLENILLIPVLSLNGNTISVYGIKMENNFNYTTEAGYKGDEAGFIAFGSRQFPGGVSYNSPDNVYAYNSTFTNMQMIWVTNTAGDPIRVFDGCVFKNFDAIARSLTEGGNPTYNVTNSIFLSYKLVLDQKGFRTYEFPKGLDLNNNWWGSDEKPVIIDMQNNGQHTDKTFSPETWLTLSVEDGQVIFKSNHGSAYKGNLPATISYIDYEGDVIAVVNIGGDGYLFTTDASGKTVLDTDKPIKNIQPKVEVNQTVYASDVKVIVNEKVAFSANFTNKWGDPLKNTTVSFIIGEKTINKTTDEKGTASFQIDFEIGKYNVTTKNTNTNQSITNKIDVITNETIFTGADSTFDYGDKYIVNFTDEYANPLENTKVNFTVNGENINIDSNSKGTATLTLNYEQETLNMIITNPVTEQSITKTIHIKTKDTTIFANDIVCVYNDGSQFTANFTNKFGNPLKNTNVKFVVGDTTINKETDEKGTASFEIDLNAGKYNITTINTATNQNITNKISVLAKETIFTGEESTFEYGAQYSVNFTDEYANPLKNTKVNFTVNGENINLDSNDKGTATLTLNFEQETLNMIITNPVTEQSITKTIHIKTKDTTIFANDVVCVYNDGLQFTANFTNKFGNPLKNTNITFKIGDQTINKITDEKGTASFEIDFEVGKYNVTTINTATNQSITNRLDVITLETIFTDSSSSFDYGDKYIVNFTDEYANPLENTKVNFTVNGENINLDSNSKGTATLTLNFKSETLNLIITNPVTGQSITKTINIKTKDTTIFASDAVLSYNEEFEFKANFTDKFGNPLQNTNVTFTINKNTLHSTTDGNGVASFIIPKLDSGNYSVVIKNPVTGHELAKTITIEKLGTVLSASNVKMVYNNPKKLTVTLKDSKGNILSNKNITFTINGKKYTRTTDKNGQASLSLNIVPKTYKVTISFNGDANYNKTTKTATYTITKATPKLTASKKTYKVKVKTKKYTITLKTNKNKAMKKVKVTLKVKGKTYKATTNNKGKATFKITKLTKKGKHTATIKYNGSKYYKAVKKTVKITIKK